MTFYKKQGRRYAEESPFQGVDVGMLIVGGVRYTLGRGSYSPSCAMDFCRENWSQLQQNTRHVIMRDVLDWLGDRHEWVKPGEHDMAWPDQWRNFLRWCFAQDGQEAASAVRACAWKIDRMQGVEEFSQGLAASGLAKEIRGEMSAHVGVVETPLPAPPIGCVQHDCATCKATDPRWSGIDFDALNARLADDSALIERLRMAANGDAGISASECEPLTDSCEWAQDPEFEMGDTYVSSCGEKWSFIDGGPQENRVRFCHGCGKPVTTKGSTP